MKVSEANAAASLDDILRPKSIAVVGAAGGDVDKLTGRPIKLLKKHGFEGALYPVNPKYTELDGHPCFKSVLDIPGDVDLAILFVPAVRILGVIDECGKKGVRAAIICSSGFGETGEEGQSLQAELVARAKQYGIRLIGPNASALVNVKHKMVASFLTGFLDGNLIDGNIAFTSNSGTFLSTAVKIAQTRGMGFSYLAAFGNESDLSGLGLVPHFVKDKNTRVVASFVEGISNWPELRDAADEALKLAKPIVLLKVGSSKRGGQVAASHTGAITGNDNAYSAAFAQHGIVRVNDIVDLVETSLLFSKFSARVEPDAAVIGIGSGGAAELMADLAEQHGVQLADFGGRIHAQLGKVLTPFSILVNPVDVAGMTSDLDEEPRLFRQAMEYLLEQPEIGIFCVAIPLVPYVNTLAQHVVDLIKVSSKPIIPVFIAGPHFPEAAEIFRANGVPFFSSAEQCIKAMKAFQAYARLLKARACADAVSVKAVTQRNEAKEQSVALIRKYLDAGQTALTLHHATPILAAYGLSLPAQALATSQAEALQIAETIGFPLAMKIESPAILHKTEVGGVQLGVKTAGDVAKAFASLQTAGQAIAPVDKIDGVLMQRMVPFNTEIILGSTRDPQLGHVMLAGMGGVWVELFKDVALRLPPLSRDEAIAMIDQTKVSTLMKGFRNRAKADIDAVIGAIEAFSRLLTDLGDFISEVELNPLFVMDEGKGVAVCDALFQLRDPYANTNEAAHP